MSVTGDGCEHCDYEGSVLWEGSVVSRRPCEHCSPWGDLVTPPSQPVKESCELGTKHDGEKLRPDLIPWGPLEQVVQVLTFGARKYADDNWQHVLPGRKRYLAAGLRHVFAYAGGERLDEESGLHHIAHAITCLMFLLWHDDKAREEGDG